MSLRGLVLVGLCVLQLVHPGHSFLQIKTVPSMRVPTVPPRRKSTKVPVPQFGVDLSSLRAGQKLRGSIVGLADGRTCRKVFVDAGVTRQGSDNMIYPVFGMARLFGSYANRTWSEDQRVDVWVKEVQGAAGRYVVSLTPVFQRHDVDDNGLALPVYNLSDLRVGQALNGTVTGITENYAFLDCGVLTDAPKAGSEYWDARSGTRKRRRIHGKLYRLDLMERFALAKRFVGPKTEGMVTPGMNMQVYVKGVYAESQEYSLTLDSTLTPEKAEALKQERLKLVTTLSTKQSLDKLLIGERRKGIITKVLEYGCKVGIGAKRTGYVGIDSISDALGKEVRDVRKFLSVGGRLEVEVDEVEDDRITLTCVKVISSGPPAEKKGKGGKQARRATRDADDDDDDYGSYSYAEY